MIFLDFLSLFIYNRVTSLFLSPSMIILCFTTFDVIILVYSLKVMPGTLPQCHAELHGLTRMEMLLMVDEERMGTRHWCPEGPPPYPLTEGRHLEKFHLKDLPTRTPSTDHELLFFGLLGDRFFKGGVFWDIPFHTPQTFVVLVLWRQYFFISGIK